jgi:hypothetical protein
LLLMAVIAAASLFTTAAIDSRALLHATLPLAGRGGGVLRAHGAGLRGRAKVNADQPLIL